MSTTPRRTRLSAPSSAGRADRRLGLASVTPHASPVRIASADTLPSDSAAGARPLESEGLAYVEPVPASREVIEGEKNPFELVGLDPCGIEALMPAGRPRRARTTCFHAVSRIPAISSERRPRFPPREQVRRRRPHSASRSWSTGQNVAASPRRPAARGPAVDSPFGLGDDMEQVVREILVEARRRIRLECRRALPLDEDPVPPSARLSEVNEHGRAAGASDAGVPSPRERTACSPCRPSSNPRPTGRARAGGTSRAALSAGCHRSCPTGDA